MNELLVCTTKCIKLKGVLQCGKSQSQPGPYSIFSIHVTFLKEKTEMLSRGEWFPLVVVDVWV